MELMRRGWGWNCPGFSLDWLHDNVLYIARDELPVFLICPPKIPRPNKPERTSIHKARVLKTDNNYF